MAPATLQHHASRGRLVAVEEAVFALAPVLPHDRWGRWMGATLTAPGTLLSRSSAASARGWIDPEAGPIKVTRPGSGGRRRHGGLLVYRSSTLADDRATLHGIPITSACRTLLDLAAERDSRLARCVREAVRLDDVTLPGLAQFLYTRRGHRGAGRLSSVLSRYSGLPIRRARSGAEVRALEILRDAQRPLPRLNVRIAGEEADLSWPAHRLIVEIDGAPFHLDVGEDARKQAAWERAGWVVRRLPSEDVYERPYRLLELSPA